MGNITLVLPSCSSLDAPFFSSTAQNGPYLIGKRIFSLLLGQLEPGPGASFLIDGDEVLTLKEKPEPLTFAGDMDAFWADVDVHAPYVLCDFSSLDNPTLQALLGKIEGRNLEIAILILSPRYEDDFSIIPLKEKTTKNNSQKKVFDVFAADYMDYLPPNPGTALDDASPRRAHTTYKEIENTKGSTSVATESAEKVEAVWTEKQKKSFRSDILYSVFIFGFGLLASLAILATVFTNNPNTPFSYVYLLITIAFLSFAVVASCFLWEDRFIEGDRFFVARPLVYIGGSLFYVLLGPATAAIGNSNGVHSPALWIGATLIFFMPLFAWIALSIQGFIISKKR